jgi:hypothetical protein
LLRRSPDLIPFLISSTSEASPQTDEKKRP